MVRVRFGSGALVFAPLVNTLMERFSKMPTYLGTSDQVRLTSSCIRPAEQCGVKQDVKQTFRHMNGFL